MTQKFILLAALLCWVQGQDTELADSVAVGQIAPNIRLNDHTGAVVTIGGPQDHWTVLAFYPKAMTPG